MKCRHCHAELGHIFVDLGFAPPSNAYLMEEDLLRPEMHFPLKVKVCEKCWLVQTEDYNLAEELFSSSYSYFSGTSASWLEHARLYAGQIIESLSLNETSFVVELASNDGYLLKNFVASNIPCLGIEPTASTAEAAESIGIPVLQKFFGEKLARELSDEGKQADLIIANNVYAHVPDINDFTAGMKTLLKEGGTITVEIPHLLNLIRHRQFDTIYHEHYSYLSLYTASGIFEAHGLKIFKVEKLTTHGGSLRIYGCHRNDNRVVEDSVSAILEEEQASGLQELRTYTGFQEAVNKIRNDLLEFLIEKQREGKKVVAYGAAAKGNTLLNYAGIKPDLLPMVFDAAPSKQGKFLPGSHIPIKKPSALQEHNPDYLLILPWNLYEEIRGLDLVSEHTRYVTAVPELTIT